MKKILLPFLLFTFSTFSQKRNLIPNDIYRIKSTGGGLVSPDGKWFVYTLTSVDSAKNNRNTDIWMMRWDGTENIQLTNSSLGVSTELIVYPGQFHGITNPAYQKDRLERYNKWFDRFIRKKSF